MESYSPADQGGYNSGLSPYDTYHCWAAAQYKEKVSTGYPTLHLSGAYHLYSLMQNLLGKNGPNPNPRPASPHRAVELPPRVDPRQPRASGNHEHPLALTRVAVFAVTPRLPLLFLIHNHPPGHPMPPMTKRPPTRLTLLIWA